MAVVLLVWSTQARYAQIVVEGIKAHSPWQHVKGQVFLGDLQFVAKMQGRMDEQQRAEVQIFIAHRRSPAPTLAQIRQRSPDRNTALVQAHATGAYSYQRIGEHLGLHVAKVGKMLRRGGSP